KGGARAKGAAPRLRHRCEQGAAEVGRDAIVSLRDGRLGMIEHTDPAHRGEFDAGDAAALAAKGLVKLRDDLVVSQQSSPAGPVFVLKDPQTGRPFPLRDPRAFILL